MVFQSSLSYLQKIAKSFSKFLLFPFLNFHVSGSTEFFGKQPTQLLSNSTSVELNLSLWQKLGTLNSNNLLCVSAQNEEKQIVDGKQYTDVLSRDFSKFFFIILTTSASHFNFVSQKPTGSF